MWLVLWLALLGGSYLPYNLFFPVKVLHHVIITGVLLYMLIKRNLTASPLFAPALVMGAVAALSTVNAIDPRVASEALWHWLTNLLLFLCAIQWFRDGHEESLFTAHFFVGSLLAASCLLQWLMLGGRPGGIFLVINLAGAYAAALVVPVWARAGDYSFVRPVYTFYHRYRVGYWFLFTALLITVAINQSRGAVVSVILAMGVFGLLALNLSRVQKVVLALGTAVVIGGGVFLFATIAPGHMAGDVDRLRLWGTAGQIFENYPSGAGPGLFAQAVRTLSPSDMNDRFTGAHNHVLTLMSELGYPGVIAGGWLLLVVIYSIPQQRTLYQNASLAALVGVMAHMLFDNYPAQNWTFLVGLYTAHLTYQAEWPESLPSFKWLSYPIAAVLLIFAVAWVRWDYSESLYLQSIMTDDIALARRAVEVDDNRLYQISLALMNGETATQFDSTITPQTDMTAYALTNFGRIYLMQP